MPAKEKLRGKNNNKKITSGSGIFWDKGRKPLSRTDGLKDSQVKKAILAKNNQLVN